MSQSTKVRTSRAVLSYPHLVTPQAPQNGGKPKYSAVLVWTPELQKDPDFKRFKSEADAAIIEAATSKFGSTITVGGGKKLTIEQALAVGVLRGPFRTDALAKGYPEGSIFTNVRTEQQPGIVYAYKGEDGKPAVMPPEAVKGEMYPGAIVRASLAAFGYDNSGNKGVSFALNNLQKLADGERIDGRVSAEDDFDVDLSAQPASLDDLIGAGK